MAEHEDGRPFFTHDGDELVPGPHARGPWAPGMLHGRLLGGLMARAIEREHVADGLRLTRLTVDLFRSASLLPVRVTTERVRDGRRIRIVDATVGSGEGLVARACAVLLRRAGQPPGEVWAPPGWDVPEPADLGPPVFGRSPFEMWRISPDEERGEPRRGRHRLWMRENHDLVEGESPSPLVRVALAADMASPMAHAGSAGLRFINADYTLALSRLPLGDVIGVESAGHLSDEGIAVGNCTLYDTGGPIGYCGTTAVANAAGMRRS